MKIQKTIILCLIALFAITGTSKAQSAYDIVDDINKIFKYYAGYEERVSYVASSKSVKVIGKSCEITIPLDGSRVYYNFGDKMEYKGKTYDIKAKHRLKFYTNTDITEDCKISGVKSTKSTLIGLTSKVKAQEARALFRKLIKTIGGGSGTIGSSSTKSSTNSSSINWYQLKRDQDNDLEYVNREFDKYNAYDTQWYIDKNRGVLYHKNKFGFNEIDLNDAEAAIVSSKSWFVIRCKNYDECMTGRGKDGKGTKKMKEYSMSLKDGSDMIPHARRVANALNDAIRNARNSSGGGSSYRSTSFSSKDLTYANKECKRFNKYQTQWVIDPDEKTITLRNKFGDKTASIYDTRIEVNNSKGWINLKCKRSGDKCIKGTSKSDGKVTMWDYYNCSMNDGGEPIRHLDDVADALRKAINSVK